MKRIGFTLLILIIFVYLYPVAPENVRTYFKERNSRLPDDKSEIRQTVNDATAIAAGFKSIVFLNGDFRGFAPTPLNSMTASRDGDTIQVICGRANGGDLTGFLGVYYTVSFDAGLTWSIPQLFTSPGPFTRNYCEIATCDGEYPYVIVNYRTSAYFGDWFTTDPLGPGMGSWTSPLLITDTLNYTAYMPSVAVNNAGDKVALLAYDAYNGIAVNYSSDYGATWHTYSIPNVLNDSLQSPDVSASRWGSGDEVHAIVGMSWFNEDRCNISGATGAFFEGYSYSLNGGQSWAATKKLYNGEKMPEIPSINGDTFIYYIDNIPGNGHADSSAVKAYYNNSTGYWSSSNGELDGGGFGFGTWWYWWDAEYYAENATFFYAIPMADVFIDYYVQPGGDLYTFPWQGQSIIFGFKKDGESEFTYDYIDVHDGAVLNSTGITATWRGNLFSANVTFDRGDGTIYIIYQDYEDTVTANSSIDALRINNHEIYRTVLVYSVDAYTTETASYITEDGYAHIAICPGGLDSIYFKSVDLKDASLIWTYVGPSFYSSISSDSVKPSEFSLISPEGDITDNTPTYVWNSSYDAHFKNYQLFANGALKATTTDTTWTNPTALSDGQYIWYVIAYDSSLNSRQSAKRDTFRLDLTPPTIPSLVSPSNSSYTTSSTFIWRKSSDSFSGVKNYELWYDDDSLFGSPSTQISSDTTVISILLNQRYFWRVRATDNFDNVSSWSARRTFVHDATPPASFSLISPDGDISGNIPSFYWNKSSDSYFKYYYLYLNGSFVTSLTDTAYVLGSPLADGQYFWRVTAYDSANNFTQSAKTDTFRIDVTKPSAPVLINPLNSSCSNSSVFMWNMSSDNFSGVKNYELWYDNDSLFGSPSIQTPSDTELITILSEQVYFWRVRAVDNFDNIGSWSAKWSFEYDASVPATPILSYPGSNAEIGDSNVLFDWTEILKTISERNDSQDKIMASQIHYVLQVDTSAVFSSSMYCDTVENDIVAMKISASGKYFWRVMAYDEAGNNGNWSNADSFRIDALNPTEPSLNSPTDGSSGSTGTFVWNSSFDDYSGIKEYLFCYSTDSLFASSITVNTTDTFYTPVITDGIYYWMVKAVDNFENESSWSDVWSYDLFSMGLNEKFILDAEKNISSYLIVKMGEISYFAETNSSRIEIFDIAGKVVDVIKGVKSGNHSVKPSNLPQGIYFVKLSDNDREIVRKLIIIK